MTVQQADDINNLFISYNDSISKLRDTIWRRGYDVRFAEKKLQISNEIIEVADSIIIKKEAEIDAYKKEVTRIEKLEYIDKKARVRVAIGLGATIITWLVLILTSVK